MKVYLAARYSRRTELLAYAEQLEAMGHESTARWLKGSHEIPADGQAGSVDYPEALRERFAQEDWDDLSRSDVVISFTEDPSGKVAGRARGGRHVEFGAALAMEKWCIVVGYRENVFHYLPEVVFCEAWGDVLKRI